ncbi:MAG: hypothetical protein ACPGVB_01500 [Chitinophagales bacterium]
MKAKTCYFVFLFLFSFNLVFAQTSGILLSASIEHRDLPYFNETNYVDAYTFDVGMDKCLGGNFVLYTGFRYTKNKGEHACNECGVYRYLSREMFLKIPHRIKTFYWYEYLSEDIGVPISLKFYFPSHSRLQFFGELGTMVNLFKYTAWEGEYWKKDDFAKTVELGPFEAKDEYTKVGVVDITGIAAIGAELDVADRWAMVLKPFVQYKGYWTLGGMLGAKRLF